VTCTTVFSKYINMSGATNSESQATSSTQILEQQFDEVDTATTNWEPVAPEPAAPEPAGTATSFEIARPAVTPEQPETTFAIEEQLRRLKEEAAILQQRRNTKLMDHRNLEQVQEKSKGKRPALPEHPEPKCAPEHSRPSSSNACAPTEHNTWDSSRDSDEHSDIEHLLAIFADEYGCIDGISKADWVAQQRRAWGEQANIPPEALEGETEASQQKRWDELQGSQEKKATQGENRAQQAATKKIKKNSVISGNDFAEIKNHKIRDRVVTRASASLTIPSATLLPTTPQECKPLNKGRHANPPKSQNSKLPPSPFPLVEGSPPLEDFVLPMRFRKTTVRGMETSSDEEPQGEGDPPSYCRPAQGHYRWDSSDEDDDDVRGGVGSVVPAGVGGGVG
jgi:hypothetical protein